MLPELIKRADANVDMGPVLGLGGADDATAETDFPTQVGESAITAAPTDSEYDSSSDDMTRRIAIGLFGLSAVLMLLTAGIWLGSTVRTRAAAPTPTPALAVVTPEPTTPKATAATPTPATPTPPASTPTPATPTPATPAPATPTPPTPKPATPKPTPRPTPKPKPTPAETTTAAGLTKLGWSQVERNPSTAAEYFRRALRIRGGDGEATYGLGYALLKLGDTNGAARYLCQASRIAGPSTRREVTGLIKTNGIDCP